MQSHSASFWSTHKRTILGLVFGLAFSATLAYAVPPSTQYGAGATLDPACAPGGTNCTVDIDGPINFVGTSYVGTTSGPGGDGSSGAGGHNIFLGEGAGDGASSSNHSNFFGEAAGFGSTAASNSNFLGLSAGSLAPNAQRSNFLGLSAGANATNAAHSNFLGNLAGSDAANASNSNFMGQDAGNGATNAANSIFVGRQAGFNDTVDNTSNGLSSILIGQYTNTGGFSNSILLGSGTSVSSIANTASNQFMLAPSITNARIRGINYTFPSAQAASAGYVLINNGSGVLSWGAQSGGGGSISLLTNGVSNGSQTALDLVAGTDISLSDNGSGSITISATTPSIDTLYTADGTIGGTRVVSYGAGNLSFVDSNAKTGLSFDVGTNTSRLGAGTGFPTFEVDSDNTRFSFLDGTIYIPTGASDGYVLTSDGTGNASWQAPTGGGGAGTVTSINVSGSGALSFTGGPITTNGTISASWGGSTAQYVRGDGSLATFSPSGLALETNGTPNGSQVLLNLIAGSGTTITDDGNGGVTIDSGSPVTIENLSSLFSTGLGAGNNSLASDAVFLGATAGGALTTGGQSRSVFIGSLAGRGADNAADSVFIGYRAGNFATDSINSVFIGNGAGRENGGAGNKGSAKASNAIFIGQFAGYGFADVGLDNTGSPDDYSILLGQNTSTGGFENSIAIGSSATNTASNQFMIGSTTRRIEDLVFNGGTGNTCSVNASTGITCSSDERLKTNISDLETNTLDKVLALRTVRYNWNSDPNGNQMIGFIAQNLKPQFPELVTTNIDGMLSVNYAQMTPILVEAIREMNLKITGIADLDTSNSWRDSLVAWLGSVTNGITKLFAGEITTKTLCVADESGAKTCLTKGQLDTLIGTSGQTFGPVTVTPEPAPETPTSTDPDSSSVSTLPEVTEPETPTASPEVVTPEPAPSQATETPAQ